MGVTDVILWVVIAVMALYLLVLALSAAGILGWSLLKLLPERLRRYKINQVACFALGALALVVYVETGDWAVPLILGVAAVLATTNLLREW